MDSRKNRSNKLLGVLCFVAVIAIWISYSVMAELWLDDVKIIENNSLFVSFVGQLSLVLFLFPTIYKAYQYRLMETKQAMEFFGKQREAFDVAVKLAVLLNAGNYFFNKGFLMGNQVSCDFIMSTTPTWVYLITIVPDMLPEGVKVDARKSKICLVFAAMLGVWLISFDDLARDILMFQGDIYILFSAVIYAFYAVGLGVLIKSNDFEFGTYLGFAGVINCVMTLPLLLFFHWRGIEIFELPPANDLYLVFGYSILATLLSEYFWAKTATLLGANLSTIAFTLVTLPAGILLDYLVIGDDEKVTYTYVVGVVLVVSTFLGISLLMDPEPEFVLTENGLQAIKKFRKT